MELASSGQRFKSNVRSRTASWTRDTVKPGKRRTSVDEATGVAIGERFVV